jgi:hypothetical protein
MEKEWIPVISGFVGVIIGGAITSVVKFIELRWQRKTEKERLFISKIEELHLDMSQYILKLTDFSAKVFIFNAEAEKSKDSEIAELTPLTELTMLLVYPIQRSKTLADLYAPEIHPLFMKLADSVNELLSYTNMFIYHGGNEKDFLAKNQKALDDCNQILTAIQSNFHKTYLVARH